MCFDISKYVFQALEPYLYKPKRSVTIQASITHIANMIVKSKNDSWQSPYVLQSLDICLYKPGMLFGSAGTYFTYWTYKFTNRKCSVVIRIVNIFVHGYGLWFITRATTGPQSLWVANQNSNLIRKKNGYRPKPKYPEKHKSCWTTIEIMQENLHTHKKTHNSGSEGSVELIFNQKN